MHLERLRRYLEENKYGELILTDTGLDDDDKYLVLVGQQMCASARQRYKPALTQPLHFLPLASADLNARVAWIDGCDVVMVCTGMFDALKRLARLEAAKAYNIANKREMRSIFGGLFEQVKSGERAHLALKRMFLRGAMAFLVGHEIGHLVAGHQGVFGKFTAFGPGASANEGAIDEIGCASMADAATGPARLAVNSLEIDADVQGCKLLETTWLAAHPNDEVERAVLHYMLESVERRLFISATSISAVFFLLGFNGFDKAAILQKSHPLTSARLVIALQCVSQLYRVDFAQQRASGSSPTNEGLMFINGCFGSLLLDAYAARTDDKQPGIAAEFSALPQVERHERLLRHTGVYGAMHNILAINEQLALLRAAYDSYENNRRPRRRWMPQDLVNWTTSIPV
jgi:hypothetical protein